MSAQQRSDQPPEPKWSLALIIPLTVAIVSMALLLPFFLLALALKLGMDPCLFALLYALGFCLFLLYCDNDCRNRESKRQHRRIKSVGTLKFN